MANLFKKLLDLFNLSDEGTDEEYDEYLVNKKEREYKRVDREQVKDPSQGPKLRSAGDKKPAREQGGERRPSGTGSYRDRGNTSTREEYETINERPPSRTERTSSGKVVHINTTSRGFEVCAIKATSFNDSQDICDAMLTGKAVVMNLESLELEMAQRVMDFVSGCVYTVNGHLNRITNNVFIISPDNVDISGDLSDILQEDSLNVPFFKKS